MYLLNFIIYKNIPLFSIEDYQEIITNGIRWMNKKTAYVFGFEFKDDSILIVIKPFEGMNVSDSFVPFKKYTAHKIKYLLKSKNPEILDLFKSDLKDRQYQIWDNNSRIRLIRNNTEKMILLSEMEKIII